MEEFFLREYAKNEKCNVKGYEHIRGNVKEM